VSFFDLHLVSIDYTYIKTMDSDMVHAVLHLKDLTKDSIGFPPISSETEEVSALPPIFLPSFYILKVFTIKEYRDL